MADDSQRSTRFSLRRWSQRKLAAGRGDTSPLDPERGVRAPAADAASPAISPAAAAAGEAARPGPPSPVAAAATPAAPAGRIALPPLESLTIDSDFSPFMQPGVDESVKRQALRTLLRHPRFNVMDGLDVYIDDYSKPSPLEPELARALMQARYIFDPPKTRVTADGTVEDVPDVDDAALPSADDPAHAQIGEAADSVAGDDGTVQAAVDAGAETRVPAEPRSAAARKS